MSLATRCTSCGTVFRVVQDQLRVSGGWVRCGRCGEVFNAIESLVDLELDRPGDAGPPSVHGERVIETLARVTGPAPLEPPPPAPVPPDVATASVAAPVAAPVPAPMMLPPAPEAAPEALPEAAWAAPAEDAPAPAFVRQADRAARWRRPGVRIALAAAALAAAGGLLWQVHRDQHDWIAARWPALRPMAERLCAVTGCRIEPPRRIDGLVVDSSGLVRAGGAGLYRLSVVLRNRDTVALRVPSLDLVLTDARGAVVARRVLDAAELGAPSDRLEGGAELPLAATLRTADASVVGYTVEIFYP